MTPTEQTTPTVQLTGELGTYTLKPLTDRTGTITTAADAPVITVNRIDYRLSYPVPYKMYTYTRGDNPEQLDAVQFQATDYTIKRLDTGGPPTRGAHDKITDEWSRLIWEWSRTDDAGEIIRRATYAEAARALDKVIADRREAEAKNRREAEAAEALRNQLRTAEAFTIKPERIAEAARLGEARARQIVRRGWEAIREELAEIRKRSTYAEQIEGCGIGYRAEYPTEAITPALDLAAADVRARDAAAARILAAAEDDARAEFYRQNPNGKPRYLANRY